MSSLIPSKILAQTRPSSLKLRRAFSAFSGFFYGLPFVASARKRRMVDRQGLTSLRSGQAECGLLLRRPRFFKGRYKRPMLSNPFRCAQRVLGPALKRHDPTPACGSGVVADREGFEPSVTLPPHTLSKRAHSTTLTPALGRRETRGGYLAWQSIFLAKCGEITLVADGLRYALKAFDV